jgi:uncharacterized protein (TIGR02466 family)
MQQQVLGLFPLPVAIIDTGSEFLACVADVLELPTRDNNLADQMTLNTQILDDPHRRPLLDFLCGRVASFATEAFAYRQRDWGISNSWGNITKADNGRNSGHGVHNHPNSVISGVFYSEVDPVQGGSLLLHNPNDPHNLNVPAHTILLETDPDKVAQAPYAWRWANIAVRTGMVVLFPSWLRHSVAPLKSGRRVSIAFNCVPRDGLGSVPDGYGLPFAKFADARQGR